MKDSVTGQESTDAGAGLKAEGSNPLLLMLAAFILGLILSVHYAKAKKAESYRLASEREKAMAASPAPDPDEPVVEEVPAPDKAGFELGEPITGTPRARGKTPPAGGAAR